MDIFNLTLMVIVVSIYVAICVLTVIFTFFLDLYLKLNDRLNLDLFRNNILNPLDMDIDFIENWLIKRHKIVGPFLIILSLVDIKLLTGLIYNSKLFLIS